MEFTPVDGSVPIEVLIGVLAALQVFGHIIGQLVAYFIRRSKEQEKKTAKDEVMAAIEGLVARFEVMEDGRAADTYMMRDLYDMHKVTDGEGRPIWYYRSDVSEMVDEQLTIMREMSASQKDTARILEGIIKQLDRLDQRTRP